MKFVLAGKSFAACHALQHALDVRRINIIEFDLIAVPNSNDDGSETWQPSFRTTATRLNIPLVEKIYDIPLTAEDVVMSIEYDRIVRVAELHGPRTYNLHFSNLPEYRGCLTSVWPLREGRRQGGVTLHVMTPGIDDGAIVDQRLFDIPEFFTSYDMYRFYNAHGFELFKKNFLNLLTGHITSQEQDHSLATYYRRTSVNFSQIEITDFSKTPRQIRDYVRSLIFKPYQLPIFQGKFIQSCDDVCVPMQSRHKPGEVIISGENHAVICCQGGYIRFEFDSINTFRLFSVG